MELFMKKFLLISLTVLFMSPLFFRLHAVEPVTMIVLAPLALKAAKEASPYVIGGMQNAGNQMVYIGKDIFEIFCLPLGLIQCTAGAPFGLLGNGVNNIGTGITAPFRLVWDVILLPVSVFTGN